MKIIYKQIYLNKLNLPNEIINIIKDFAFQDIVISNIKKQKAIINLIIQTSKYQFTYSSLEHYLFWARLKKYEDKYSVNYTIYGPLIYSKFCIYCGNYLNLLEDDDEQPIYNKILCNC